MDEQCGDEYMGLSWVDMYLEAAHKAALFLLGDEIYYEIQR
jgi:hypothetical protein